MFVKKGTSAFGSQRFKQTNRVSSQQGIQALTALETSQQLRFDPLSTQKKCVDTFIYFQCIIYSDRNAFKLDKDQGRFALPQFSLKGSKISDTCPSAPTACVKDAEFRAVDGTCNNQEHPEWGRSNTQLQRLLPPEVNWGQPNSLYEVVSSNFDINYHLSLVRGRGGGPEVGGSAVPALRVHGHHQLPVAGEREVHADADAVGAVRGP